MGRTDVLSFWPSLSLLLIFLVIFLECRAIGGRVTLPLGSFLMVFCYGAIGAPLIALLLQQIPMFPDTGAGPPSPLAWLVGPPIEELAKAVPVIVLAFLTREARRLSIADLTLIGFASGAGFGFVEGNLNVLANGALPDLPYWAAFGLQSQAGVLFFAGHPVSAALVGLAAGIGLRFLPSNYPYAWAPAAFAILWASFDHGIYNWKVLPAGNSGALPEAHVAVEVLHLLTLHGQLQTWLLPVGLVTAQLCEAYLCSKAAGARRDLLLAREWRPWVINEWLVALMRAPLGRAAFTQTLGYFRLRRAFYLAAFEARRDLKDPTLSRHARSLEDRLKRERSVLFDPPSGTWLLPMPVLMSYAAQWTWRMRWVLIFAVLLLFVFMLDPGSLPEWLRQFLFGEAFTIGVISSGLAFAVWRIVLFARRPRPDPMAADGAAYTVYYTRALLLGCSLVCGLFPAAALLLGWKALAPGAAFISGYLPGWIAQGGNLQTLLGLGTIGAAVAPDPRPAGEALRQEIAAGDERIRRLGSHIGDRPDAGAPPLSGSATPGRLDAFLERMAKLDAERDAQARRQLALDECARQARESTVRDPAPAVQAVKDEFDRLANEMLESAAKELDSIAALEQAYGRAWTEIMQDLDAHDALRRTLTAPLRHVWQGQSEIAWALRVAEATDECLLPMQLTLLPELQALAATAQSAQVARLEAAIERIRAAASQYGEADPFAFAVATDQTDKDQAALLAELPTADFSDEAPKPFGLRTPQPMEAPEDQADDDEAASLAEPAPAEIPAETPRPFGLRTSQSIEAPADQAGEDEAASPAEPGPDVPAEAPRPFGLRTSQAIEAPADQADEDEAALPAEPAPSDVPADAPRPFGLRTSQAIEAPADQTDKDEAASPVEPAPADVPAEAPRPFGLRNSQSIKAPADQADDAEAETPSPLQPPGRHYQEALDQLVDATRRDQTYLDTIRHLEVSDESLQQPIELSETEALSPDGSATEPVHKVDAVETHAAEPDPAPSAPMVAPALKQVGELEQLIDSIKRDSGYLAFVQEPQTAQVEDSRDQTAPADSARTAVDVPAPKAEPAANDAPEDKAPGVATADALRPEPLVASEPPDIAALTELVEQTAAHPAEPVIAASADAAADKPASIEPASVETAPQLADEPAPSNDIRAVSALPDDAETAKSESTSTGSEELPSALPLEAEAAAETAEQGSADEPLARAQDFDPVKVEVPAAVEADTPALVPQMPRVAVEPLVTAEVRASLFAKLFQAVGRQSTDSAVADLASTNADGVALNPIEGPAPSQPDHVHVAPDHTANVEIALAVEPAAADHAAVLDPASSAGAPAAEAAAPSDDRLTAASDDVAPVADKSDEFSSKADRLTYLLAKVEGAMQAKATPEPRPVELTVVENEPAQSAETAGQRAALPVETPVAPVEVPAVVQHSTVQPDAGGLEQEREATAPVHLNPERLSYLLTKLFGAVKQDAQAQSSAPQSADEEPPPPALEAGAAEEVLDLRTPAPASAMPEVVDIRSTAASSPEPAAAPPPVEPPLAEPSATPSATQARPSAPKAAPKTRFGARSKPPSKEPIEIAEAKAPAQPPTPEPAEAESAALAPPPDWKLGSGRPARIRAGAVPKDSAAAAQTDEEDSAAHRGEAEGATSTKKTDATYRVKLHTSGVLATVDAPPPPSPAAGRAPGKYYGPRYVKDADDETKGGATVHPRNLADALNEFYAATGQPQPPMHTTDRATLQRIIIGGKLEAPLRRGAPWSVSGMSRRGEVVIRLRPGAEQFVEFVPSKELFGQIPHYYPRGVGKGTYATHIPVTHLEYFDLSKRQWAPVERG